MFDDRIYYEDQSGWGPVEYQGLWRYLNRLFQFVGPTPGLLARPESRAAQIQARRTGLRDEELAALDLSRMSEDTLYLMKHTLILQDRYALALEKFPNLRGLADVGDLGHQLVLDENPTYAHPYFTEVGILL